MIESAYSVKPHPLSIVIFSKDRAAQLDLCLKSIHKNFSNLSEHWNIYIIYTSSSKDFEDGYRQLIKEWYSKPNAIYFFPENKYKGFKKTLEYCMRHWEEYVLFFTDDDIVYRSFQHEFSILSDSFEKNENLLCASLRLGTNTFVQDQYINSMCLIPDEVIMSEQTIKTWDWKTQSMGENETNFGYPFSLDGHMFKVKDAIWIIENTEYYNPNTLEAKAHRTHVMDTEYAENLSGQMCCFKNSYVINTPLNRVQETFTNSAGVFFKECQESLNEKFLKGGRLTLSGMDFSTIIGVHQELKLCWDKKCY